MTTWPQSACPACGAFRTANERYCTRCGRSLPGAAPGDSAAPPPPPVWMATPRGSAVLGRVILSIHFLAILPAGLIVTAIGLVLLWVHLALPGLIIGALGLSIVAWAIVACVVIARMESA